jgi:hypothetical protein
LSPVIRRPQDQTGRRQWRPRHACRFKSRPGLAGIGGIRFAGDGPPGAGLGGQRHPPRHRYRGARILGGDRAGLLLLARRALSIPLAWAVLPSSPLVAWLLALLLSTVFAGDEATRKALLFLKKKKQKDF